MREQSDVVDRPAWPRKARSKNGRLWPHNETIAAWRHEVEAAGGAVTAGGAKRPEVLIRTPGGFKEGRRPDIIYTDSDGNTIYGQVGRMRADECDHLGTPQELTDEAGELAWSAQYKAWGAAQEAISNAARKAGIQNPLRFQGQYYDHENGLHYNRHRYYDPVSGRFVSKDPIRLRGGINFYQYAPNPIGWVDPLGLVDINLFPSNEAIRGYADKVPSNPSTFQVGAHGNPDLIVDEQGKVVSAKELAAMINKSPNYKAGKTVELLSCNTGKGNFPYAQALADELGADVHAPDQYMWYYSDGRTVPMGMTADGKMDHGQLGTVRIFKPARK